MGSSAAEWQEKSKQSWPSGWEMLWMIINKELWKINAGKKTQETSKQL